MNKETKEILQRAISDVGYWKWWNQEEEKIQIKFGAVLLFDDTKKDREARTSDIALVYCGNAFIIFLDNDEQDGWFDELHKDVIDPYTLDAEGLVFDNAEYAINLIKQFKNKKSTINEVDENIIKNAKYFVAATSGNVGFIAGGDELKLFGYRGLFKENDIKQLSEKWWEYWNDYWKKRGTESAYDKDYACEVTIPVRS